MSEMRLAGICGDCRKRLGVDDRRTLSLQYIQISKLPEYDPKTMAGVSNPVTYGIGGRPGTTKITYKIAKTVKESIDDAASHDGHSSTSTSALSSKKSSKKR